MNSFYYMPRARPQRRRPVIDNALAYRQRLRNRQPPQEEVVVEAQPRRQNRNRREAEPVQQPQQIPEPPIQPIQDLINLQQAVPPVPPVARPQIAQQASQGVQTAPNLVNGEELLNLVPPSSVNTEPLLLPYSYELDIFVAQNIKEKIWNLGYIDLSTLLKSNFNVPNDMQNCIGIDNGRLVVSQMNKILKKKSIDNIDNWTDAFLNYSRILLEKHNFMALDLMSYMSIIRGALSDSSFDQVYLYDQQFRLRKALNPSRPWSQIDGNLWLRFIAKAPTQNVTTNNQQRKCYDFNFKRGCFRLHCSYLHSCIKCNGMHAASSCNQFAKSTNNQVASNRKATQRFVHPQINARFNTRPPLLGNNPSLNKA